MSIGQRPGRAIDSGKREAIVSAARRAFLERGFAATAIEQVAADAGVSKVTVYNHFGDKRALFAAVVETECARLSGLFSIDPLPPGTLREQLTAIGEAMIAFLFRTEIIQFERRIAAETEQDPEIGKAFIEAGPHKMVQAFARFICALADSGRVIVDDPQIAAEQFAGMCKGLGDLERRFGRPRDLAMDARRIEAAVETFCRAYSPDGACMEPGCPSPQPS